MKSDTIRVLTPTIAAFVTFASEPAHAQYRPGIQIETVNSYSNCYGSGSNLSNSNSSGAAFATEMARVNAEGFSVPGTPNSCGADSCWWQDNEVYDTDFLDPDTSGASSSFNDTNNFDQNNRTNGIAFFQGHGFNEPSNAGGPPTGCTASNWQTACAPAPAGTTGVLGCVVTPGSEQYLNKTGGGSCHYNVPSKEPAYVTCSNNDYQHFAYLSQNVKFGESGYSGGWAGAATNGGVGLVFAKHSFGMWLPFASQWWPVFAGMDLYAGVAIGWGDSNDSPGYGYAVANPYSRNPTSSVRSGYLGAMNNISDGDGSCPTAFGGTSWPGGMNGCGCHAIMTLSSTAACGQAIIGNETWQNVKNSNYSNCQTGNGYYYWYINCNYNPVSGTLFGGP
jgi:hypothetical protein